MKVIKTILLLLGVILLTFNSLSQSDTIIVIDAKGEGNRVIKPTSKHVLSPKLIEDTSKSQIKADFVFYEYKANSELQLQPISPAKLKIVAPLEDLRRGFVKGGIGMYTTPLLEVYYNSVRSKKNNWGVHGRHLSSNSSIKNTGFSGLSENKVSGFYQQFYNKFSIKASLLYNRSANHFYGFNSEDTTVADNKSIKQVFNTIGGGINFRSYYKDSSDINFDGTLNYLHYFDFYDAKENNIVLDVNGQKMINTEIYRVDFGVDFNNYKSKEFRPISAPISYSQNEESVNNTIIKVNPKIITARKKLYASFGVGIYLDAQDNTKFHFYPDINVKYSFLDIFVPYLGITGGLERNSFRSLTNENPFLLSQVGLQNTNTKYNIYGGIRGSVSDKISFNARIARKKIEGKALYVSDTTYSIENKFDVIYESLDVTEINAQLTYLQSSKLRVFFKGEYNFYNPLTQDYLWNNSPLKLTLGGVYDLADKILVRADIFFIGTRKAKSYLFVEEAELNKDNTYAVNQKAFLDFNLGFEYRYNKNISAFLNFNNIVGQKYLMYYKYPVQGINILGGATFRF